MTYIYDNSIMFISLIAFFIYWIQIIYKHKDLIKKIEITDSKVANLMKEEMRLNREEFMLNLKNTRQEISENFALHLNNLTLNNLNGIKDVRNTLEYQLENLRKENEIKLEQMRMTVDEKLNSTLEKRLNQSFKLVGDRLDQVNLGIGEMQRMATEVNNLQKVLGNIKTRGIFGEEQLDRILSDFLTPDQFERNVKTKKGSNAIVEFAVKLPGNEEDKTPLWLPIDSKFPIEDYQRIIESTELGNSEDTKNSIKQLELKIKLFAKEINGKYIDPPYTKDFGILFLPTEGLYSEVLRINGLQENLRREHNVVITGPSTLVALLNSLQMGFRTLAVEKRSNEIRKLLGTIKKDFSRFGELLEKTQEKLDEASKQIGEASHRSKIISNKLTRVETLPQGESLEYISYNGE